jgi:heptosyltransferase I
LVKLSSMGDVIHNFPVVSDLARAFPGVEIDWLTEAPYAELVGIHPSVRQVFPVHLRALKKHWLSPAAWRVLRDDKARVKAQALQQKYDAVLDTQGLVKSALLARWGVTQGTPIIGYSRDVARESLAARFYTRAFNIANDQHAVQRNRELAASAFGYVPPSVLDYGIAAPDQSEWRSRSSPRSSPNNAPYVVLLHATSRADKQWPLPYWQELGTILAANGVQSILPWGAAEERITSEKIAAGIPNALIPPPLKLSAAAAMLAGAIRIVGVDTGLAHLAVALKRPTVGLYITTRPSLTGLLGGESGLERAINLGGGTPAQPSLPTVQDVVDALKLQQLQHLAQDVLP